MASGILSQIVEDWDREQRIGSPPLAPPPEAPAHPVVECRSDLSEQEKKVEENRSLLEELSHIEAELRESLRLDVERQRESEFLREQENRALQQSLNELSLSQRIGRPWVSSYFRNFPMHIYCLPIQAVNHRSRRRGLKKTQ